MPTKVLVFVTLALGLASQAFPAACPGGPYSLYLAPGFSCQLGNLTFFGFGYVSTGNPSSLAVPASTLIVTPITTPGNEGLQFGVGMNVASSESVSRFQDSLVNFSVSTQAPAITGLQMSFDGAVTGTGITGSTETYCVNNDFFSCPSGGLKQLQVNNPPPIPSASTTFAPAKLISLSKDISATSGINGTAAISKVINTFPNFPPPPQPTGVPLPPSLLLTLTGMAASGLYTARRRFLPSREQSRG